MRKDAQKHRAMLIEAAVRVFSRDGYEAPMAAVLAEAGLGRGTLYRHFQDKDALALAAFDTELDRMEAFVEDRLGQPSLLHDFLQHHSGVSTLAVHASRRMTDAQSFALHAPLRERSDALYDKVMIDAKRSGALREDVQLAQLRLAMRMIVAVASKSEASGEDSVEEKASFTDAIISIILDGISTGNRGPASACR